MVFCALLQVPMLRRQITLTPSRHQSWTLKSTPRPGRMALCQVKRCHAKLGLSSCCAPALFRVRLCCFPRLAY